MSSISRTSLGPVNSMTRDGLPPPGPILGGGFSAKYMQSDKIQQIVKAIIYDLMSNAIIESVKDKELTLGSMDTIRENVLTSIVKNTVYKMALQPYIDSMILKTGLDANSVELAVFASNVSAGFVSRYIVIMLQQRSINNYELFFDALYGQVGSYVISNLLGNMY